MKTERITISADEQFEIFICKPREPDCDGHRTGVRSTMTIIGPCTISWVKSLKVLANTKKGCH
jgi:hypothetical protein